MAVVVVWARFLTSATSPCATLPRGGAPIDYGLTGSVALRVMVSSTRRTRCCCARPRSAVGPPAAMRTAADAPSRVARLRARASWVPHTKASASAARRASPTARTPATSTSTLDLVR